MIPSDKINAAFLFLASITGLLFLLTPVYAQHYDAYYNFLGNYPDEKNPGYHENVQGITHDDAHWYITQTEQSNSYSIMWKIPVECDLSSPSDCASGISKFYLDNIPDLRNQGYDHFGDPDCHQYNGAYYVFIPIEGGPVPAIMVVQCSNLAYIGYAKLAGQSSASWCAIEKNKDILYGASTPVSSIYRYKINWQKLFADKVDFLEPLADFAIKDESNAPISIEHMQGGAISENDDLIYVVSGFYDEHYDNDGINVFDLQTGLRVQRSTNGSGYFNYEFHPGWSRYEEPEGITVWDVDGLGAPNVMGQLHVMLLDNDRLEDLPFDPDDVYIKHYTNVIYVNGAYVGEDERGRPWDPFNTVTEAVNFAWDGAKIKIQNGSYAESISFIKKIQLLAKDGTVTVGNSGRLKFDTSAAINLTGGKCFFKLY